MDANAKYGHVRAQMVRYQLLLRGIRDPRVLEVMGQVPRHEFISLPHRHLAYSDARIPIGDGQMLEAPWTIGLMLQALALQGDEQVLLVSLESGYTAALLMRMAGYIYCIENSPRVVQRAGDRLEELHCEAIDIHQGDGTQGLPDMAPFRAILVMGAVPVLPGSLCRQLHPESGRMVIAIGPRDEQSLQLVTRQSDRWNTQTLSVGQYTPLTGRYGFQPAEDDSLDTKP